MNEDYTWREFFFRMVEQTGFSTLAAKTGTFVFCHTVGPSGTSYCEKWHRTVKVIISFPFFFFLHNTFCKSWRVRILQITRRTFTLLGYPHTKDTLNRAPSPLLLSYPRNHRINSFSITYNPIFGSFSHPNPDKKAWKQVWNEQRIEFSRRLWWRRHASRPSLFFLRWRICWGRRWFLW